MRFHGLMLVRDEADIIAQNLQHVLEWADNVFIFDTGSVDGTWEIISEFARSDARIKALEHNPVVYSNALRAYLFEKARPSFNNGDWIVKLDADEFFHITPPEFVRNHLARFESCVWLQWYFFRLTTIELGDYESRKIDIKLDRQRPIEERRRFYKVPAHSEPRMFKYRIGMKWSERNSFPYHAGLIAKERIPIRHYPHRDPIQMKARFHLRAEMARARMGPAYPHWRIDDWRKEVIEYDPSTGIARERTEQNEGLSAAGGHTDGGLVYWRLGESLPPAACDRIVDRRNRFLQWLIYPGLVPLLDRVRRGWSADSHASSVIKL